MSINCRRNSADSCVVTADSRRSPSVLAPLQPGCGSLCSNFPNSALPLQHLRAGREKEGEILARQKVVVWVRGRAVWPCGALDLGCPCAAAGGSVSAVSSDVSSGQELGRVRPPRAVHVLCQGLAVDSTPGQAEACPGALRERVRAA